MRFPSDLKSVYYLIVYSVLLGIIIYLSSDIYRLVELNIHSEEYVRSACPDGEKIRVNNPDYIPAIFENMTYERGIVTEVIDGDTIELGDCRKIRYMGINSPETVHPEKPVECYGNESSDHNAKSNKKIKKTYVNIDSKDRATQYSFQYYSSTTLTTNPILFSGSKDRDVFGRYLRYIVRTEDGLFVNLYLVENGYSVVYEEYKSDNIPLIYEVMSQAQIQSKNNKVGLWEKCLP